MAYQVMRKIAENRCTQRSINWFPDVRFMLGVLDLPTVAESAIVFGGIHPSFICNKEGMRKCMASFLGYF